MNVSSINVGLTGEDLISIFTKKEESAEYKIILVDFSS